MSWKTRSAASAALLATTVFAMGSLSCGDSEGPGGGTGGDDPSGGGPTGGTGAGGSTNDDACVLDQSNLDACTLQ